MSGGGSAATREVDVAIVGAGTAGLNALSEVRRAGRTWLLIDPGPYGTTCARVGCMPSKLLIAAANAAHDLQRAARLGIRVRDVVVDVPQVMARLRRERDRFVAGVVKEVEQLPAAQRLCGSARFVDARTLAVGLPEGEVRVRAGATVIATGSTPQVPKLLRAVREKVLTSESVFELDTLPESLAVIGGGPVGLELGQALSRLGVAVTLLDRGKNPGPCTDPVVNRCVVSVLQEELQLERQAEISAARLRDGAVELTWSGAEGEKRQTFAAVLAAAGRPPQIDDLCLEATGLELDEHGMPPWDPETGQCGDAPIFMAGDVNHQRPLLHEASEEGRICGGNAARWPKVQAHRRRTPLSIVFCDPEIAMLGQPWNALESQDICIGEQRFDDQGRARVLAVNRGIIRLYGRRVDHVLVGAELFGPRVEHMAHWLAWAVQQETPVQTLLEAPFYHPTFEEGLRSALRDLARNLGAEGACRPGDMSESPGA